MPGQEGKKVSKKVHKGFLWSAVMQFANHASAIVITILLANLLLPSDFGLVAKILVITEFSRVLLNFGFGQALVQKQNVTQADYSSVFWFNLVFGAILSILLYFSAPLVAAFYQQNELIPITQILAISYVIASLGIVPQMILIKKIDFKSLAVIRVLSVIIAGGGGLCLAYLDYGIWSLVFIEIVRTTLVSVLSWFIGNSWRPSFLFSIESIKSIFGFSVNLFGNETLNYWMDNLDKVLIGRMIGDNALGLYRQSYSFMMLPVNNIARTANNVLFPSLSKIQDNIPAISAIFIRGFCLVCLVIFPVMLVLFTVASSFIETFLGANWIEMTYILKIFSIVGIFYTLSELTYSFFLSIGRSNTLFITNLIARLLILISIIIGLFWGLEGIAIGLLLTSPIRLGAMLEMLRRHLSFSITSVFRPVILHGLVTIVIALIGVYFHDIVVVSLHSFLQLMVGSLFVFSLYLLPISLFFQQDAQEFFVLLKKIFRRD